MSRADLAFRCGDRLISAGMGLDTLADLLGADGSEHHLSQADRTGLLHAVRALAELVTDKGFALAEAFEPLPATAGQQAVEDLNMALAATSKATAKRKGVEQ
jgi:hypothetical protein